MTTASIFLLRRSDASERNGSNAGTSHIAFRKQGTFLFASRGSCHRIRIHEHQKFVHDSAMDEICMSTSSELHRAALDGHRAPRIASSRILQLRTFLGPEPETKNCRRSVDFECIGFPSSRSQFYREVGMIHSLCISL